MNKQGDNNIKLRAALVVVLACVLFIGLGFLIGFKFDNPMISENVKEEKEVQEDVSNEVSIESLLKSNYYFQDIIGVGSNFTNLYQFKNDGTFLYSSKTNVTENDQIVLASGTWVYSDEVLKLTFLEQHVATDFNIVEDGVEGIRVADYKLVKKEAQVEKEYDVELANVDGMTYIDGDIILYQVALMDEEVTEFFSE